MQDLTQKWADFKIPAEIKAAHRAGAQLLGSLGFTKMIMFAKENKITNTEIDYYMSLPPRTLENETREEMKMRGKLSKALYKYRKYLYDYSVYNK
jgi:hypothetical protein